MKKFTGIEYIKIDIANQYGYEFDKKTWKERIHWTNTNIKVLEDLELIAKEPILYAKAVRALRDAEKGKATGFIMGLDATASGLQIMACLIGCHTTAANVNLADTGKREDIYSKVADRVNKVTGLSYSKADVKKPVMTTFYGSKKQPEELFGKGTDELKQFHNIITEQLPGAMECMKDMQDCWNPFALTHQWTLPDGHVARVPVMQAIDKKVEIDELNHATYTFRAYENKPAAKGLSLAANIIHSIDGYIVREMVRRADLMGFALPTIHDSFWASPNHMNEVRQNYLDILIEITLSDLLGDILREITDDNDLQHIKLSNNLHTCMTSADYALS